MPLPSIPVGAYPASFQESQDNGQTSPETNSGATPGTDISSLGESLAASKKATGSQMQLLHRASSLSQRQLLPNPDVSSQTQNQSIPSLSDILSTYGSSLGENVRFTTMPLVETMKKALPPHAAISQEAIEAMQACVSWFIQSISAEAVHILNSSPTQRMRIEGDNLLKAMTNKNFRRYAQALRPYLENYRTRKHKAKAAKLKSKSSNQEEDSAKTQSSRAVTGLEVAVVPGGVRASKRRMSGGNVGSEANETPTGNWATGEIVGPDETWMPGDNGLPVWTSISGGHRMLGRHGMRVGNGTPGGNGTTGGYGTLERTGTPAGYGMHGMHGMLGGKGAPAGYRIPGEKGTLGETLISSESVESGGDWVPGQQRVPGEHERIGNDELPAGHSMPRETQPPSR